MNCRGKDITLLSSDFLDLIQGREYTFEIGSTSHIIVNTDS